MLSYPLRGGLQSGFQGMAGLPSGQCYRLGIVTQQAFNLAFFWSYALGVRDHPGIFAGNAKYHGLSRY